MRHALSSSLLFAGLLASVGNPSAATAQSCLASCPSNADCGGTDGPPQIEQDQCAYPTTNGCPVGYYPNGGCCVSNQSPIIIDLASEGFHLSNAATGVWFRPYPKSNVQYKVAWPEAGVQNGWLTLDRNGNGTIDDFSEMFGNETPQPEPVPGKQKNGFAALAVFDTPAQGGNGDGWISNQDAVYPKLRVWVDLNHDGVSQPSELVTLVDAGIGKFWLGYKLSRYVDDNGNIFRYRSFLRDLKDSETSRVVYDVYVGIGDASSSTVQSQNGWSQTTTYGFVPRSMHSRF